MGFIIGLIVGGNLGFLLAAMFAVFSLADGKGNQ